MFGFFKSKRDKLKQKGERGFEVYISSLKGMAGSEIGFVLDGAASIKNSTVEIGGEDDMLPIFRDPITATEKWRFDVLDEWEGFMQEFATSIEGQTKTASLMIWYLSLIACQIPELRLQGRIMWGELERGFVHTDIFDPKEDTVIGLEPNFD